MSGDFDKTIDTIKTMFEGEQGSRTLDMVMNMLNSDNAPELGALAQALAAGMSGSGEKREQNEKDSRGDGEQTAGKTEDKKNGQNQFYDLDMLMKMKSIFENLSKNSNSADAQLLTALKPHLSGKRAEKVDQAIKMLQLSKMTSLFKEIM